MNSPTILLAPHYIDQVRAIINRSVGDAHGTIYVFGSRAWGNPRSASDIDLAVAISGNGENVIRLLRENFENSSIPYTVDIVAIDSCGTELADEVVKNGVVVWNG